MLSDLIESAERALPREVYLKVLGDLCRQDMETRIKLGLVHKLRIPAELAERLRALAKPRRLPESSDAVLELGGTFAVAHGRPKHKIVLWYKKNKGCARFDGVEDWGVLTRRTTDGGLLMTDCAMSEPNDRCRFFPSFTTYDGPLATEAFPGARGP